MKQWIKRCAAGCAAAVLSFTFLGCSGAEKEVNLALNGHTVTNEEFVSVMNTQIYDVTDYFYKTYGASVDGEFWTKDFNGEIPYEMLAEATVDQLKYYYAVYEHAMEMGYVDSVTYDDFLARMENENKIRKEKIERGEAIYGLMEYSEELYREYELDIFQKAYCDNPENEGMNITDEQRQAYYEEYKDTYYTAYDDISIDYLKVFCETEEEYKSYKDKMTDIYKSMDQEHSLEMLIQDDADLLAYFASEDILSNEYSVYARTIPDVLEYAMGLSSGESTQVIESENVLYLIECTSRTEHDYHPIEEVADNINAELRESIYDTIVDQRADEIQVSGEWDDIYLFTNKKMQS